MFATPVRNYRTLPSGFVDPLPVRTSPLLWQFTISRCLQTSGRFTISHAGMSASITMGPVIASDILGLRRQRTPQVFIEFNYRLPCIHEVGPYLIYSVGFSTVSASVISSGNSGDVMRNPPSSCGLYADRYTHDLPRPSARPSFCGHCALSLLRPFSDPSPTLLRPFSSLGTVSRFLSPRYTVVGR